ncbi:hypothetical protein [Enterococcus sp. DIV1059_2]|uniref:hypothetical protein n=1 Tax=Enterococcus sp. DIV1059_2 TaxID=2774664 RepID=UPI003F68721C
MPFLTFSSIQIHFKSSKTREAGYEPTETNEAVLVITPDLEAIGHTQFVPTFKQVAVLLLFNKSSESNICTFDVGETVPVFALTFVDVRVFADHSSETEGERCTTYVCLQSR